MPRENKRNRSRIIYLLLVIIIEFIVVYIISYYLYLKFNPVETEEVLRDLSHFSFFYTINQ